MNSAVRHPNKSSVMAFQFRFYAQQFFVLFGNKIGNLQCECDTCSRISPERPIVCIYLALVCCSNFCYFQLKPRYWNWMEDLERNRME